MRAFKILIVTSCLLAAGAATAQSKLDGWGQFKFGMTPDEARGVPGASWKPAADKKAPVTAMESLPMTSDYGPDTHVALAFNADQKLREIRLYFNDAQSPADCEKAFQKTVTDFDKKYGAFAALGTSEAWSVPGDSGQSLLERTTSQKLPGSRSQYWRRSILPNISGLNLETETKRAFGSRAIELAMLQKNGKDGCYRSIAFTADMPTKAEVETQFKLTHIPTGMDWRWSELDRSARGFSTGPVQAGLTSGVAENVKLSGGKFTADIKRPPGSQGSATLHLAGTVIGNKIAAHIAATDTIPDGFPTDFNGAVSTFATDGEPVDTYEINLTGTTRQGSTVLDMAAYHRNSPHTPTPETCRKILDSVYDVRGTVREATYRGFYQTLGCQLP